jgi:hypothetical protein
MPPNVARPAAAAPACSSEAPKRLRKPRHGRPTRTRFRRSTRGGSSDEPSGRGGEPALGLADHSGVIGSRRGPGPRHGRRSGCRAAAPAVLRPFREPSGADPARASGNHQVCARGRLCRPGEWTRNGTEVYLGPPNARRGRPARPPVRRSRSRSGWVTERRTSGPTGNNAR